jgi:hypothetical protein
MPASNHPPLLAVTPCAAYAHASAVAEIDATSCIAASREST